MVNVSKINIRHIVFDANLHIFNPLKFGYKPVMHKKDPILTRVGFFLIAYLSPLF